MINWIFLTAEAAESAEEEKRDEQFRTLTHLETELVLETGITVGGKTLREHLEVIGHRDAIDYIETLTRSATGFIPYSI